MSQKKTFSLRPRYNEDDANDSFNIPSIDTPSVPKKTFSIRKSYFDTPEYQQEVETDRKLFSDLGSAWIKPTTAPTFEPTPTPSSIPTPTITSIFKPTATPTPIPKPFSNTFIDKPQEETFINKFHHVVRAIEENPVVDFVAGFGATVEKTLGLTALRKQLGDKSTAEGLEKKAEEFGQKHPVASFGTQIGSYLMPIAKGTQVISKVPKLKPFAAPLAAAGFETAKGMLEELPAEEIAKKAATSAAFMGAGGAATKALEKVGSKILQNAPQILKNSIAAELTKNVLSGAGGGVAGGVVASQITAPGELPSSKEMLYNAVLMGVMHGFNAIPGTLMQAKGVSEQLKQDTSNFAKNMNYLNTKAVTEPNIERKIEYYTQMRDGIDSSLSNLHNNRFVGSNKIVENLQEGLMFGRNSVDKKINDLSGLLNKSLSDGSGSTPSTPRTSTGMAGGMSGMAGITAQGTVGLPKPVDTGFKPNIGAFVPQQSPFKTMVRDLPQPSQLPERTKDPFSEMFVPDTTTRPEQPVSSNWAERTLPSSDEMDIYDKAHGIKPQTKQIDAVDEIFGINAINDTTPGPENTLQTQKTSVPEIDDRTYVNVGSKKVKSIQQIKPELAPHIQQEAKRLITELTGSQPGKRMPVKDEDGYVVGYRGEGRVTSDAIERILDNFPVKPTYKEIQIALEKIVRDGGAENNALSKRIELVIDDNLSMGTRSIEGVDIPANMEYVNQKNQKDKIPEVIPPKPEQTPSKPKQFTYSKDDIPFNLAKRAHDGTSFDPERRAKTTQESYVRDMERIENKLNDIAKTPEQKQVMDVELNKYKQKYIEHMKNVLTAKSKTMSSMITGPSNFPVAKNRKALDHENKVAREFIDWAEKALKAIEKKIKGAETEEFKDNEIAENLKKQVKATAETMKGIEKGDPYSPALIRSSLQNKLIRAIDNGHVEAVKDALEYLKEVEKKLGLKKPVFSAGNMIWEYANKKLPEKKTGEEIITDTEQAKIIKNNDLDRIQIIFDGKPSSETIKDLKSAGWNWSPSNKAWQRKLTVNAERSAESIVKKMPVSPIEKTDKTEYNNSEDIKTGLTKTHPEYTESVEGRNDLETATEAIQDLQKLEANREKGAVLPSYGRKGDRFPYKVVTKGNAISVKAIQTGKVKIKGAIINDVHDLAEIAQVFRDPRFETMRYVFVKDNVVVHYEAVSSAVAGMCAINPYIKAKSEYANGIEYTKDTHKWIDELRDIVKRTGADGYYLLHNHPGGSMKASGADIAATDNISKRVPGFKQHLIINSNKYHVISQDERGWKGSTHEKTFHEIDKILTPSKEHMLLNTTINSVNVLGDIALHIKYSKNLSTLIHVNSQNEITGIQEVPNEMINDSQALKDFLKPLNKQFGSNKSFIVTNDGDVYKNFDKTLITDGFVTDLAYTDKNIASTKDKIRSYAQENPGVTEKKDFWMGKDINEYPAFRVKEHTEKYNKKPFFSKLQQVLEDKMPNRADKDLIYNLINKNGVKQEEIKWSGLNDFMKGKDRVGKQELLDFLRMNELQIEEIDKGFDVTIKYSEVDKAYIEHLSKRIEKRSLELMDLAENSNELLILISSEEWNKVRDYLKLKIKGDKDLTDGLKIVDELEKADEEISEVRQRYPKPSVPKYTQYQLQHGENYRELLFQLPRAKYPVEKAAEKHYTMSIRRGGDPTWEQLSEQDKESVMQKMPEYVTFDYAKEYTSSHWDEPNVLAHVRLNDRTDSQGNKLLFIEELQSDWHQAGRKNMYKSEYEALRKPFVDFLKNKGIKFNVDQVSLRMLMDAGATQQMQNDFHEFMKKIKGQPAPDAPFQKTWHEFVLKRMIRYAVENGYDKIAWTTGDMQNKRYSLSNVVDTINAYKNEDDTYDVRSYTKNGVKIEAGSNKSFIKTQIIDLYGTEIGGKIINDTNAKGVGGDAVVLSGKDLEIGGSGMKGFYDKIIPDYLNQYGKKWMAKVGKSKLSDVVKDSDNWEVIDVRSGVVIDAFDTEAQAKEFINSLAEEDRAWLDYSDKTGVEVHTFPITESMKKSVMGEGQALFEEPAQYKPEKEKEADKTQPLTSPLPTELPPASGANVSGRARRASEIIKDFEERFLNKVRVGKINRANVLGYFQIRTHVIRLRKANDIPTFTHEAGHLIDKLYNLSKVGTMTQSGLNVAKVRDELLRLGKHTTNSKDDMKLRKEGIAEFTRLYLTDQPQAFSRAPETFEYFKKAIDPDLMGYLDARMQDIWDLVNLTPEDRVMRDVWDKTEVDKSRANAEGLRLKLEQFYTQTVEEYFPAIKDAKLLAGEAGEKRIKQVLASYRGYEASAMFSLNPKGIDGMYQSDLHYNKVGPSLFNILEPLSNDKKKQDYFWKAYAIARRAEDYHARNLQLPQDIETYRQTVKNLEIKYPDFPEIFKRVRRYDDNLLNVLVQAGFFSKEQAKEIMKKNPNHIHLFRVMDDGITSIKSQKGNPVKALKGGGQDILNPYESMVNMTFVIWGAAKRQQLLLELADMANKAEGMGRVMVKSPYEFKITEFNLDEVKKQIINSLLQQGVNLDDFYKGFDIDLEFDTMVKIFRPNFFAKANQLAIYRNGKIELYDVEPELYKALSGMNPVTFNAVTKTIMNGLMKVGDFQAATILYTPRFVVYNTIRESLTAWLQTRAGISVLDIAKGAVSVMKNDPWFLEAVKHGGTTEMFLANEAKFVTDVIKELSLGRSIAKRVFNNVRHPLNTIREVIKFTELGTKTAEAKKTIENRMVKRFADQIGKGLFVTKMLKWIDPNIRAQWKTFFDITNTTAEDWDEAIYNMRDLTYDLKRKGKTVRELNVNRIWRFFNAYVQGMDQAVRTAKDPNRIKGLLIKGMLLALYSMVLHSILSENEWYKKLKPYQKDNFWNIPIGDPKTTKKFLPVPRGFEWSIPFMAVPVRMMDYFYNDNPDAWDGFATSLRNNFMFEIDPMPLRPFVEQATNTTWQGIPIENYGDKLVSPEYRFDDRTSEVAKGIARGTNKLPFEFEAIQSPKRLEHLIRGFTGTIGGIVISALDQIAGKPNYKASDLLNDLPYLEKIKDIPGANVVISGFLIDAEKSNTIREEYYEGMEKAAKGYNDLKKSGEITDKSLENLVLKKVYDKFDNGISKLTKLKKALAAIKTDEAHEDVKKIDSVILQMQKDRNGIEKMIKEDLKKGK